MNFHLTVFALVTALLSPSAAALEVAGVDGAALLASAALDRERAVERIAFGSCFKEQRRDNRIWDAIRGESPDLFVFNGDTVYPDEENEEPGLPSLREAYETLAGVAPFTALRQTVPVLPLWDDHDYGMNDGGADFARRQESERLFEAAWISAPDDPRRQRPGVYHSETLGPEGRRVQLILLDTRYFRSPLRPTDSRGARGRERYLPDADAAKTLLGDAQWRWLETVLREPAELRLLVSSIQVIADGHGWEGWRQLPLERERLFALLRQYDDAPVLVLSGDRHMAGFYERDIGLARPLLEFTSSALNNPIPFPYRRNGLAEEGPYRLGPLFGEANFGLLRIDWSAGTLTLSLNNRQGERVRSFSRPFGPSPLAVGDVAGDDKGG